MILGYVEDKKNTLALVETGNDGREGISDYVKSEMGGGLDRVMYVIIKENNSSNKYAPRTRQSRYALMLSRDNSDML